MTDNVFKQVVHRLRARLREALAARVVWMAPDRRGLEGQVSERFALVAILGREHYEIVQRRYPVRGLADLRRVLKLEFPDARDLLCFVGPFEGEAREVTLHRLMAAAPRDSLRALFWVPETLLLLHEAREHGVISVERAGLNYFVAANGTSLLAGGAIRDARVFALASGVSVKADPVVLTGEALRAGLLPALTRLPVSAWWGLRSPVAIAHMQRFAAPAALFAAIALIGYLALASLYFMGMDMLRTRQLAALGPEVSQLLSDQRTVETLSAERAGLARVIAAAEPVWPVWEIAATVWRLKGAVYGLSINGDLVTVRCTAPEATAVLEALRALKGFRDARFDTAVRAGGAGQEFTAILSRAGSSAEVVRP